MNKIQRTLTVSTAIVVATFGFGPLSLFGATAASAQATPQTWSDWQNLTRTDNGITQSKGLATQYTFASEAFVATVYEDKLHISHDKGVTWAAKTLPTGVSSSDISYARDGSLIASGRVEQIIPNSTSSTTDSSPGSSTIILSSDAGTTWNYTYFEGFQYLGNIKIFDNGTIMAPGFGNDGARVLYSTDRGTTWASNQVPNVENLMALTNSNDGQYLYAIYDDSSDVHVSADGGATWEARALPADYSSITAGYNGVLYAFGGGSVIHVSNDAGQTWSSTLSEMEGVTYPSISYVAPDQTTLLANINGGIWVSRDAGQTWSDFTPVNGINPNTISYSKDGRVIGVAMQGDRTQTYLSTNYGQSWSIIDNQTSYYYVFGVAVSDNGSTVITSGTNAISDSIKVTSNNGASWNAMPLSSARPWGNISASSNGEHIYSNEFASHNSGASWTAHSTPFTFDKASINPNGTAVHGIGRDYSDNGTLKIASSQNSGQNWNVTPLSESGSGNIVAIEGSDDGKVGIAHVRSSYGNYLYVTNDYGQTWEKVTLGGIDSWSSYELNKTSGAILVNSYPSTQVHAVSYILKAGASSWTQVYNGQTYFRQVLLAPNGESIIRINGSQSMSGQHYYEITHNDGQSWSRVNVNGTNGIFEMRASSTGTLTAAVLTSNFKHSLAFSEDNGATWTLTTLELNGIVAKQSKDGSTLVAQGLKVDGGGNYIRHIQVSKDNGQTWNDFTQGSYQYEWKIEAISDDGSRIVASINDEVFGTVDGGANWTNLTFTNATAQTVIVSEDGKKIYHVDPYNTGYIQGRFIATPIPPSMGFTPANPQSGATTPTSTDKSQPQKITNTKPTFSGKATPNSIVVVTVRSDPITCTTTADADGNWSCTLPSTIPAGVHTVTVEVTDAITEETTLLGPFYVSVDSSSTQPVTIDASTPRTPNTGIAPLLLSGNQQEGSSATVSSVAVAGLNPLALFITVITVLGIVGIRRLARQQT